MALFGFESSCMMENLMEFEIFGINLMVKLCKLSFILVKAGIELMLSIRYSWFVCSATNIKVVNVL